MDYYANQRVVTAFNDVTLTNSYDDNKFVFNAGGFSKLTIDTAYAMGSGESANTMEFKLEHSPDGGQNWYSLVIDTTNTISTIVAREWTMAPAKLDVIVDIAYKMMRLSLKESGVVTNYGKATVSLTLSGL